jgi:hypothetical protein
MGRNNPMRFGVVCAAMVISGLYLVGCTHGPIEPAPVYLNPVSKTINSTTPAAINRAPAPILRSESPSRTASAPITPPARPFSATQHPPGLGSKLPRHAAHSRTVVAHNAHPHIAKPAKTYGAIRSKPARLSTSETIPLDEPVTTSAGPSPTGTPPVSAETPSAWVTPAPAEASGWGAASGRTDRARE